MQILQPEHIKDYLDAADKRGLLPMFYLELVSGLRKSELTALLWSGLDIQNRSISVMLSHYDAGFPFQTYTRTTRQKQNEAAHTMGCFIAQVM